MKRYLQQGFLTVVAAVLIMVIGFLGVVITQIFFGSANSSTNESLSAKAFYLAEVGLEYGTHVLLTPTLTNRISCANLNIASAIGEGDAGVSTTGPYYVTSTTSLNGALTATATSITVTSTANYQSMGRIMVDRELINYASKDATHFLGVTRGVDSSTATTHITGTDVGQYQCNLVGAGGVPSLNTPANPGDPGGKRLLNEYVQLQEAWAVGDTISSQIVLTRWNRPTELAWTNASVSGAYDMNGISMVSYVDGWAVGSSGRFIHWDGNAWAITVVTPSVVYESVYCNSGNDCQAVGAASGTTPAIVRWNGTSWSRVTPGGSTSTTALRGVHCSASNNCWAVGSNAGLGIFYQWNGTTWTGVSMLSSSLSGYPFNSVFCNSATNCWAVGANATFARRNGTSWANFATGMSTAVYNSVFCNSSTDCWAVGEAQGARDLIVHWNGSSWSRDPSAPTPVADLRGITCAGTNDCWAVGKTDSGINTVFVHWNGNSWTQFTTGTMPATTLNSVDIVHPLQQPQAEWNENFG